MQWLSSLTSKSILFCHCHPQPCHCDVIARASAWAKTRRTKVPVSTGFVALPFGKFKSRTLVEVADENIGYLDWLQDQPWLWPSTAKTIRAFLSQPQVAAHLDHECFNYDTRCGGKLSGSTAKPFIPSEQTTRFFSLGAPTWCNTPQEPRDWQPPMMTKQQAWSIAADYMLLCESAPATVNPNKFNLRTLKVATRLLSATVVAKMRIALVRWSEQPPQEELPPLETIAVRSSQRARRLRIPIHRIENKLQEVATSPIPA
jgi:hypothetical protein